MRMHSCEMFHVKHIVRVMGQGTRVTDVVDGQRMQRIKRILSVTSV